MVIKKNSIKKWYFSKKIVYFWILLEYTCTYCLLSLCKRSHEISNS